MSTLAVTDLTDSKCTPLAPSQPIKLHFPATPEMRRQLTVELSRGQYVYVYLWDPDTGCRVLASTYAPIAKTALSRHWPTLWVGDRTQFQLTESEAAEIERVLGPRGLKVDLRPLQS